MLTASAPFHLLTCQIHAQDPAARTGIYEHPIIQELLNVGWFANKQDEGIIYGTYFRSGIGLVTIALILTVVCISLSVQCTSTD